MVVHMSMWPKASRRLPLMSPVPLQTWRGRAHSTCRCGRGEPSPGADVTMARSHRPSRRRPHATPSGRPAAPAPMSRHGLWHAPNNNAATSAVWHAMAGLHRTHEAGAWPRRAQPPRGTPVSTGRGAYGVLVSTRDVRTAGCCSDRRSVGHSGGPAGAHAGAWLQRGAKIVGSARNRRGVRGRSDRLYGLMLVRGGSERGGGERGVHAVCTSCECVSVCIWRGGGGGP